MLAVRLRETAATASEAVTRGSWSLAAVVWFGWTVPQAEARFQGAMFFGRLTGIWDPTEMIFRMFATPTPVADAFDWYLVLCGLLLAVTVLDVAVFYWLHRKEMTRIVARVLSRAVTVLIIPPAWLMNMIVAFPLVGVWNSLP